MSVAFDSLADYTRRNLMVPQLGSGTAEEVIGELAIKLDRAGSLEDRAAFLEAVMARERLSPTYCPPGWALPHARLANVPELTFALGKASQPLSWSGDLKGTVNMVWLFAVPERRTKAYLNLIASIARFSQNAVLVDQLTRAADTSAMLDVLRQAPLRASPPPLPQKSFPLSLLGR